MAHEIIKNGIIGSIETLVEMAATVTTSNQQLHQIDIDLLLEQIRKLYREVQLLDEANRQEMLMAHEQVSLKTENMIAHEPVHEEVMPTMMQETIPVMEETPEIETALIEHQNVINDPKEDTPEEILPVVNDSPAADLQNIHFGEETLVQEEMPEVQEESPIMVVPPVAEEKDVVSVQQTLGDKLLKEDRSLNQQLSERNNLQQQRLHEPPVTNLKTAIGINDKFMFVNELFKGDMKAYDDFISQANISSSLDEALQNLHITLQAYDTLNKNEVLAKLSRFIHRRFQTQ